MSFPQGFVWGAAAASYQIEGAAFEDGKGLSVWDMLCRKPGAIWSGHSGEVACDHYHRYQEDVGNMQAMGLQAYRLSISWPRVMPEGVGAINDKGLEFYDRLVDALLAANVKPYITLFHWDYPYELFCRGGWLNRDSSDWFADYTRVVVEKLSDRVQHWMTLNEPQCFIGMGHYTGEHAPGIKLPFAEMLRAGHNCMLAHGKAVQTIRAHSKGACQIGYAPVGVVKVPASDSSEDIEVTQQAMFSITEKTHWNNTWWMDPVMMGHYPEDGLRVFGNAVPEVRSGDMETICQPLDFFGTNIYNAERIKAGESGKAERVPSRTGHELTAFRWQVTPDALYWGPRYFWERYKLPIVITENGLSNIDWVSLDGKVHDPQRIDYTGRHLLELHRAGSDGVDIRGYFHWSLMDNFEWAEGYKERFGLIHVDYPTQQRTLKDSAHWYAEVIRSHGATLTEAAYAKSASTF